MGGGRGGDGWVRTLASELRVALRALARAPGFTVLSVGVLALGIATATAVFSAVNAYLIRPLPYPEVDRLVEVRPVPQVNWDEADDLFEHPVSWDLDAFTVVGDGPPELLLGSWVTPGYLEAYGVRPALGRSIRTDEAGDGRAAVVMISWNLWQRRFGGDPGVLGTTIQAFTSDRPDDAESFEIIGVLPSDFWTTNRYQDILAPLRASQPIYTGRLRPGVTPERAGEELTRRSLERMESPPADFRVVATPIAEAYLANVRPTLLILLAVAGLVLVAACANAAMLILVRAASRTRESAIRTALGAGRWRLVRERAIEGALLALPAAALGTGLAALGLRFGAEYVPSLIGRAVPGGSAMLRIDATVLALSAVVAMGTALLFGVLPTLAGTTRSVRTVMGEGGRGGTDSRRSQRIRTTLVGAELAVSLGLLATAGLSIRSAIALQNTDPGFDPEGVLFTQIQLRNARYPDVPTRMALYDAVRDELGALPGVTSVGRATRVPYTWGFGGQPLEAQGPEGLVQAPGSYMVADSGYFATLRIPILRGRGFTGREGVDGVASVLLSERLAASLFPDGDPLGRNVRIPARPRMDGSMGEPGEWMTVVGVVGETRTTFRPDDPAEVYFPLAVSPASSLGLVVRAEAPEALPRLIVERLRVMDPEIPTSNTQPLAEAVDRERTGPRFFAALMAAFAIFTALLATAGLYGVIAYSVAQRRRDIAVRMALGADRSGVVGLFVRSALLPLGGGAAVGVLIAWGLTRVLASQLHGVGGAGVGTYLLPTLLLGGAALVATWIPARRAAGTDPMTVLRED